MQPHEPALPESIWLQLARADLTIATTADSSEALPRGLCCFHCQQAAEKALKAVLVSRGKAFRKAHDLAYLTELLADDGASVPGRIHAATRLNEYSIDSRYPDDLLEATPAMLVEAIELSQAVVEWAEQAVHSK